MKESHLINKFNSGELSKLVHSRTDYTKRDGGAEKMENFIPLIQGPMTARSGTKYLGSSFSTRCGLIPFEYSITQSYMIEASANLFRFIKNRAFLTRSVGTATVYAKSIQSAVSNITSAYPSVVSLAAGHGLSANDHFSFSGVSTATGQGDYLNNKVFIATSTAAGAINSFKRNAQESTVSQSFGFITTLTYTGAADFVIKPCRFTLAAHGLVTGDVVLVSGITGGGNLATALNGNYYRVAKVDANNFDLLTMTGGAVDTSAIADTTITGNTFTWVGVWHPYSQTDLFPTETPSIFSVGYAQSTNTLFLANKNHHPGTLTRSGDTSWVYVPYRTYDGPYMDRNITSTTVVITAGTNSGVFSAVTGLNSDTGLSQNDVGKDIRICVISGTSYYEYGTITAVKTTTTFDMTVEAVTGNLGYGSGVRGWQLGLWGSTNGYPSTVSFCQDRLCWGGVTNYPERVDMSCSGVYNRYAATSRNPSLASSDLTMDTCWGLSLDPSDDNAISVSLLSNEMNYIKWISGTEKGLVIGTANGEWLVSGTNSGAMTPTNTAANLVAPYGSIALQPVRVGSGLIHVQRSAKKMRSLGISQQIDGFSSKEITMQSEHIPDSGVCSIAYQKEPWSIIWAVKENGDLVSCTYDETEDAIGWGRHQISPGTITGVTITSTVECIACIPDPLGDRNDVFMIVKRIAGGVTFRYIEYFGREFINSYTNGIKDSVCLDTSYTVNGTPSNTITASWLGYTTSTVVADGQEFSITADVNGLFTIPGGLNYRNITVGIPFTPFYKSLDIVPTGDRAPQGIGKIKKITQAVVRLYRTLYGKIGRDINHVDTMNGYTAKTITGVSIASPGVITTSAPHGYLTDDTILINKIVGTVGTSAAGINGETYKVVYISSTTFSLKTLAGVAVDTTGLAYTSGGECLKISNGYQVIDFPGDFDREAAICIKQTNPFPITVISATIDLDTKV